MKKELDKRIKKIRQRAKKDKKYKKQMTFLWAAILTLWTGLVFFVAELTVFWIAQQLIDYFNWSVDLNVAQAVCMVISYIIALAALILVPKKLFDMKITRDSLGLHGLPTWTDVLLGPVGYIVSMIATVAVMAIVVIAFPGFDLEQAQDVGFNFVASNPDKIIIFITLVVLAPIVEELIFRGFLYGQLRSRISALPAIIIVSVLFGVMHGQWNVGIVVGIMSVFMCIARELTGTIYAGIFLHMIRNGISCYLLFMGPMTGASVGAVIPMLLPFLV